MEKLLNKYEGTNLFQILLNIVLVYAKARDATLVELNNFPVKEIKKNKEVIEKLIKDLNLNSLQEPFSDYRFFVVKESLPEPETDEDIAEILEFICKGHDYSNQDIIRLAPSIYEKKSGEEIIAEICESDKISMDQLDQLIKNKIKRMNKAMKSLNLEYRFDYSVKKIYPRNFLLEESRKIDFVKKNLGEYVNLIYNYFYPNSKFVKNPDLILENFDLFLIIISIIESGYLEKKFGNISDSNRLKKIEKIYSKVHKIEEKLFEIENL